MTDVHEARVEAAARVMYDGFNGLAPDAWEHEDMHEKSYWLTQARAALAAADAVVTVEMLATTIHDFLCEPGCEYGPEYDEAHAAAAIHRLYRGGAGA